MIFKVVCILLDTQIHTPKRKVSIYSMIFLCLAVVFFRRHFLAFCLHKNRTKTICFIQTTFFFLIFFSCPALMHLVTTWHNTIVSVCFAHSLSSLKMYGFPLNSSRYLVPQGSKWLLFAYNYRLSKSITAFPCYAYSIHCLFLFLFDFSLLNCGSFG